MVTKKKAKKTTKKNTKEKELLPRMPLQPRASRPGAKGCQHPKKVRREHIRRAQMWQAVMLYAKGYTQLEIAEELGVTQEWVSQLIRQADNRYEKEIIKDRGIYRASVYRRFMKIYYESMDAWKRSIDNPIPAGDPRMLAEARHAMEQVAKLLGLNAPERIEMDIAVSAISNSMRIKVLEDPSLLEDVMELEDRMFGESSNN